LIIFFLKMWHSIALIYKFEFMKARKIQSNDLTFLPICLACPKCWVLLSQKKSSLIIRIRIYWILVDANGECIFVTFKIVYQCCRKISRNFAEPDDDQLKKYICSLSDSLHIRKWNLSLLDICYFCRSNEWFSN